MEPIDAEILDEVPFAINADPIVDPEEARYAPQPPRRYVGPQRLLVVAVVIGLVWIGLAAAWSWAQRQYYVGEQDGVVVIFRGLDAEVPGLDMSTPYEVTDVQVDHLSESDASRVEEGFGVRDLDAARQAVRKLAEMQETDEP